MKFTLTIKSDNAAFDIDQRAQEEVARLLTETAEKYPRGWANASGSLFDSNGNRCGSWKAST